MDRLNWVELAGDDHDLLFCDGYDHAIIGVCYRFGQNAVIAYDRRIIIQDLMNQDMTYEDAEEFFNFNIIGAWVGEKTPVFIERKETSYENVTRKPNLSEQTLRPD